MILTSKEILNFWISFNKLWQIANTSKLFIPYITRFRQTYQKARRSIKKRTETKVSTNAQELSEQDNIEVSREDPLEDMKPAKKLAED